jgi:DNA topoisomerase-1
VVGKAEDGTEIIASPGRFGPYLKKGDDTRSLPSEDSLLTVTLEEANEIFAQPKRGRGRGAPEALAELGAHPESGAPIKLLAGRYGPYVTDGTTNASIPKGVDPAAFTLDEAVALLKTREEAGPAKKPKRAPAKKAPAKKAAAKKKKG